jgi:sugar O-acyltransferase (sialic acid O-acetyltransferase NeuD family)
MPPSLSSSKKPILIFGSSDLCRQVIRMMETQQEHNIIGIIDPHVPKETSILGYPVLGDESALLTINHEVSGLIAIGDNCLREKVAHQILKIKSDFEFITLKHASVHTDPSVTIGSGSIILPGALILNHVRIGNHTLIGTGTILEHDSHIGDFCNIGPGCITGGHLKMGNYSVLGLGTRVNHHISIGSNTVIGSGALVLNDIPENVVAFGSPAEVKKHRSKGEAWL